MAQFLIPQLGEGLARPPSLLFHHDGVTPGVGAAVFTTKQQKSLETVLLLRQRDTRYTIDIRAIFHRTLKNPGKTAAGRSFILEETTECVGTY